jgi:hypothetical protein
MKNKNWCEHIKWRNDATFWLGLHRYEIIISKLIIPSLWKYCPICGKKRPNNG